MLAVLFVSRRSVAGFRMLTRSSNRAAYYSTSARKPQASMDDTLLAAINGTCFVYPGLQTIPTSTNDASSIPNIGLDPKEEPTKKNDTPSTISDSETPLTTKDFNITVPKILSPSALKEFESCPQSFFFQYILKLKQPTNTALAKGSMCHTALEHFLALDISDRNLTVLHNLYRKAWAQSRDSDTYKGLFADVAAERDWGLQGLACLTRYFEFEPNVVAPNPVQRETWVRAQLAENITVRGIVDRLDLVQDAGDVVMRLMDYKTGKAPDLKYSPAMNAKIEREAWDQLVLYSLLLRESKKTPIRFLRLIYLGDETGAKTWDKRVEQSDMDAMKDKILRLWADMTKRLESDDPFKAFEGCSRSFCWCHKCRPRFQDNAVWQPPLLE